MKKLINDPRQVVRELLEGLVGLSPGLALMETENVVVRADLPAPEKRNVAVISGGGSGHEPAHAGYVGLGLLTAAVAGDVFTSPSADAVFAAIMAAAGPAGALLVVKNYTGDRLNFGLAAEMARQQGIPVEMVLIADDVGLSGLVPEERRRGIAGTVLIHKLAGAAAEQGRTLAAVAAIARSAAAELGSMGVGLGAATVPAVGTPGFELGPDEIEFGLGIHGEKGVERTAIAPVDSIVGLLLERIVADRRLSPETPLALLVNGLGGTSAMELMIASRAALALLRQRNFTIRRAWAGNYLSAMEMPGISLSLLPAGDERERLFDAPAAAFGWTAQGVIPPAPRVIVSPPIAGAAPIATAPAQGAGVLVHAVACVAESLEAAEPELTDLDSRAGDGDLGASMLRGAAAMRRLDQTSYAAPSTLLTALGNALRKALGGSSGPFYAIGLMRAGAVLAGKPQPGAEDWTEALRSAIAAISELGGARAGDRTMLDALCPALEALESSAGGSPDRLISAAATAAEAGAQATAGMRPAVGRASYLGARAIGAPDAGAIAVAIWMRALADAVAGSSANQAP